MLITLERKITFQVESKALREAAPERLQISFAEVKDRCNTKEVLQMQGIKHPRFGQGCGSELSQPKARLTGWAGTGKLIAKKKFETNQLPRPLGRGKKQ